MGLRSALSYSPVDLKSLVSNLLFFFFIFLLLSFLPWVAQNLLRCTYYIYPEMRDWCVSCAGGNTAPGGHLRDVI